MLRASRVLVLLVNRIDYRLLTVSIVCLFSHIYIVRIKYLGFVVVDSSNSQRFPLGWNMLMPGAVQWQ